MGEVYSHFLASQFETNLVSEDPAGYTVDVRETPDLEAPDG